jgi:DNA-binding MarR family transcriptional regulator
MTTTEPWLTRDEQSAWRAWLDMHHQLESHLGRALAAGSDLSMADFGVLVVLTDVPDGRTRAYELGRALQWEKSRLSHHLTRMEKRGLIRRESCPSDARGAYVVVTDAGRTAIEAAAPAHVAEVRRLVFDALTPEQVAAMRTIAELVLSRLDPDAGCDS